MLNRKKQVHSVLKSQTKIHCINDLNDSKSKKPQSKTAIFEIWTLRSNF
jgi:hypothetical protein